MTELKHRKGACVMAYLILANEEARVRRTHGALENRPPPAKKLYQRDSGNHASSARALKTQTHSKILQMRR